MSWTVKLSKPTDKQIEFFDKSLGGESQATISVLRMGTKLHARLVAQGEIQKLEPYFGQTVEFALQKTIPVKKGWVLGADRPDLGAGAGRRPRRRHVLARVPRPRAPATTARPRPRRRQPDRPLLLPLPHGADHVLRPRDLDAVGSARPETTARPASCGPQISPRRRPGSGSRSR